MNIIITKNDCPKCEQLKEKLNGLNNFKYVDSTSIEGMSLLAYHMLFDKKTTYPLMITKNDDVIFSSIDIKNILKQEGVIFE